LGDLPVLKGREFCKKRSAVGKKVFVTCTEIVQPGFTVGCEENPILRAPPITQREHLTIKAIVR
jgi:hypothetical protein